MEKDVDESSIPAVARVIYFNRFQAGSVSLQRLLKEPIRCDQVVTLDMPRCDDPAKLTSTGFDLLCEKADLFPRVRSLSLGFTSKTSIFPDFWTCLYEALPRLKCLFLRGRVPDFLPRSVRFEELEVVDLEKPTIDFAFHFPAVRHAAFRRFYPANMPTFKDIPRLESLLLRIVVYLTPFNWETLPNLRFLGVSAQQLNAFAPLPPNHPLHHLYVSIGTVPRDDHNGYPNHDAEQSEWINQTIKNFPSITRLTLVFPSGENWLVSWISGHFSEEDCELLGLQMQYYYDGYKGANRRIVYYHDPTIAKPQIKEPEPEIPEKINKQHKGLQAKWNKFYQSSLRKLHL